MGGLSTHKPNRIYFILIFFLCSSCSFEPDIQVLEIPELSTETGFAHIPDQEITASETAATDPGDGFALAYPAESAWIDMIESAYPEVDVLDCFHEEEIRSDCVRWTENELTLLSETLGDFLWQDYLDIPIQISRDQSEEYGGIAHLYQSGDERYCTITISDQSYTITPTLSFFDQFDLGSAQDDNYQGVLAHELTHAAVWAHPELLDQWQTALDDRGITLQPGNWFVGYFYNWGYYDHYRSDSEYYQDRISEEMFAMTTAGLMYESWWGQTGK